VSVLGQNQSMTITSSGAIAVASGAVLDVSGGPGGPNISNNAGQITIRAPILTNHNVNVRFAGTVIANGGSNGGGGVLNAYATWSTTDPTGSGGAGTHFDGIIDPGGYYQDGSITQLVSGITNEPTRSPRKPLQYNTLSSSPFAPAGLTRAFGGQGLFEKRAPL
jgi:hypothetical protein